MEAEIHDLDARRRRDHARLRLDRAGDNLTVLARLGKTVMATKDSDPDIHQAAQQMLHRAVWTLIAQVMERPCELEALLKLAGAELGRLGWTGYPDPGPADGTAAIHESINRSQR